MRYLLFLIVFISINEVSAQRVHDKFFVDYNYEVVDSIKARYRKTVGYFDRKNNMTPARVQYDILPDIPFLIIWYKDYWKNVKSIDSTFYPNGNLKKVRYFHFGYSKRTISFDTSGIQTLDSAHYKNKFTFFENGKETDTLNLFGNLSDLDTSHSVSSMRIEGFTIPRFALRNNLKGRAIVSFDVTEDGKIEDFKIDKRPHPCYDEQLYELQFQLPFIQPLVNEKGETVRQRFMMPINFNFY